MPSLKSATFLIKKIFVSAIILISSILFIVAPLNVSAQSECQIYNPNLPNFGPNCIPLLRDFQGSREGLSGLIVRIADFAIFIVGALAVLMLVYAGFLFITDGGNGERAGKAKKIIFNVIVGIILAIASYTIVTLVTGFVSTVDINNLGDSPAGSTAGSSTTVQ